MILNVKGNSDSDAEKRWFYMKFLLFQIIAAKYFSLCIFSECKKFGFIGCSKYDDFNGLSPKHCLMFLISSENLKQSAHP